MNQHQPLRLPGPHHTQVRRWFHDPRWRLVAAAVIGVIGFIVARNLWDAALAPLIAWSVTALAYCAATAAACNPLTPAQTAQVALDETPHRLAVHILLLGAATAALIGVAMLLLRPESSPVASAVVTLLTVASSWTVVQVIYALRYAREYYKDRGGINFNMKEDPQYSDFAYVAFTMGMTFQVSDTVFTNSRIRRIALGHALLTYIFGTIFLAAIVNVLASLGST